MLGEQERIKIANIEVRGAFIHPVTSRPAMRGREEFFDLLQAGRHLAAHEGCSFAVSQFCSGSFGFDGGCGFCMFRSGIMSNNKKGDEFS